MWALPSFFPAFPCRTSFPQHQLVKTEQFSLYEAVTSHCTFWFLGRFSPNLKWHERFFHASQGSDVASSRVRHGEAWPGLKLFLHSLPTWSVSWLWTSRLSSGYSFPHVPTLVGLSRACVSWWHRLLPELFPFSLCRLWKRQIYCFCYFPRCLSISCSISQPCPLILVCCLVSPNNALEASHSPTLHHFLLSWRLFHSFLLSRIRLGKSKT